MAMCQSKTEVGGVSGAKKQLPKNLCDAMQVTPRKKDGWSVLVQVVVKRKEKEARSCPGLMYKNYVLTDMRGTKIPAVTFGSNVTAVDRLLFPYKRYYISNAGVRDARDEFRLGDYPYNWVLTYRTPIRLLEETIPHELPCPFQFAAFSDMHRLADRDVDVEFKALVVHSRTISGSGETAVREYVVVDQEMRPMIMRLWGDWLDNTEVQVSARLPTPTIIVGLTMKVTTHNAVSLTTRTNGYLMVDPPLPGNDALMAWYNENATEIARLVADKAYRNTEYLIPRPTAADIVPIQTVISSIEDLKTAWVRATIHLIPGQESLWHTVCGKCRRGVDAPVGWTMPCSTCLEDIEVEPRSRFGVFLFDGTKALEAILYSPDTEKLVPFTDREIFEAHEKGSPLNNEIEALLAGKRADCFLKYFESDYGGKLVKKFPILKVYPVEELAAGEAALPDATLNPVSTVELVALDDASGVQESQLFSPTYKNLLDEIEEELPEKGSSVTEGSSAKRALTFGANLSETSPATSTFQPGKTCVTAAETGLPDASPTKKVKGKEKEKQN